MTDKTKVTTGPSGFLGRLLRRIFAFFSYTPVTATGVKEAAPEPEEEDNVDIRPIEELRPIIEHWVHKRHFTNPELTIEQTLNEMGILPHELNYYLDTVLHIRGFRRWIPYLRIEEAKRLLTINPNYTLEAIADMCGYSNRSTLSRSFKTLEGISPSEWVKKHERSARPKGDSHSEDSIQKQFTTLEQS